MNRMEISQKMKKAIDGIVNRQGYVSFIDVLMSLNKLTQDDYQKWRNGGVSYLERVLRGNLNQLNFVLKEFRSYCLKQGLKPSWTGYYARGKGNKKRLQFSKSGSKFVEEAYATHYVKEKKDK
ncbi:hypothetical protein [Alkalihalobacterium chitinilyticum]|uniref:Uncharacterized protein n=1 Tax=Alkalihalobacterium chitinilyticum TaxID=2980103 RepID=A0ABT5VKT5_9BACI|nr:hypothetical protein [Alkalihalobacterium chitinilyticum]MDE5416058.1 hypothetical protein [Alkalihalobacterium chitinilyticum]